MSDPRLAPEELERRRRIRERHPDVDEANALVRAALSPARPTFTATERKESARQALALLTASAGADLDDHLIEDLIDAQGGLPLVTASVLGLSAGLLKSFDDVAAGASDRWLAGMGRRLEAMPEGEC